jgi:hypothetical protein
MAGSMNLLVGLLGYFAFGDELNDVVILNLNMKNPLCFLAIIFFALSIIIAFPL